MLNDPETRGGAATPFQCEVADRFGVLPNFFCTAQAAPGLIEELWGFAKAAYLDSPLPSRFKERLFVHLSRFCEVRYCIVRHVGFLLGNGRPAGDADVLPEPVDEVIALLRRPIPDAVGLAEALARLAARDNTSPMPEPGSQAEADLIDALTVIFVEPAISERARVATRAAVGDARFELLAAYLAFIRTAHYWTETHPELAYEPDMLAMMGERADLTALLLSPSDAERVKAGRNLRQVLAELQQTEAALRASEVRFRAFVTASSDVVYRMSPDWSEMRELDGHGFIADAPEPTTTWMERYIHPDDRQFVQNAISEAIRTKSLFDLEHRVRRPDDSLAWTHSRAVPILDQRGTIVEWLGAARDVTERRLSEERQTVLVAELQHRTRNLVAVVRSIFGQTVRASDTLTSVEVQFNERLEALARVQGLLSQADQHHITIGRLLRTELDALGASEGADRIKLAGPDVPLRNSIVQTLALALHELATNARKYGALTGEHGSLDVRWREYLGAQDRRRLELIWTERGLDARHARDGHATEPGGYGRELIEKALPYALGAKTSYELGEKGVDCVIDLPLDRSSNVAT